MPTIADVLRLRARQDAERLAYVFLQDGKPAASLTYLALDRRARGIAERLRRVEAAGPVLLLYPSGLDFIAAFFGCLYAGLIAVPLFPPRRNRADPRLAAVIADAQPGYALTTREIASDIEQRSAQLPELKSLQCIATDGLLDELETPNVTPVNAETPAFLQYTSGSTSTPKGVIVSHSGLLLTLKDLDVSLQHSAESVMVTWLPLFHDLGLIYGILQPLHGGFPCYLMDPATFSQRPLRWLEAISTYGGTHSPAPNFAYDLCARTVSDAEKGKLDLRGWRVAFNAAEPVRAETLQKFAETFAPCGFTPTAFCPAYGLAEATLKVTGVRLHDQPNIMRAKAGPLLRGTAAVAEKDCCDARTLVGCGVSEIETRVAIVDPKTMKECAASQVGEVWVKGGIVALGYWRRAQETAETFAARIADTEDGPFLRTGDLGFLHDGELFITGRVKDIIIIRGMNHYPQDIEATAERSHPALRPGCGASFSLEGDGEEQLIVTQEVERTRLRHLDFDAVIRAIRAAVAREHDLAVDAVILLRPGSVSKTSSGKIQRGVCRARFEAGQLRTVAEWRQPLMKPSPEQGATVVPRPLESEESIRSWILSKLAERTGSLPWQIDPGEPFVTLGIDSLNAVRISGELEDRLGRKLPPTLLFEHPTPNALARFLASAEKALRPSRALRNVSSPHELIAIIGMACRFPGAPDIDSFWNLLRSGEDTVTSGAVPANDTSRPSHPLPGHFLNSIDRFDAEFFGLSPREAQSMDPQQRLLLEVAWEAMEDSGRTDLAGSETGVFIGISSSDYSRMLFASDHKADAYGGTGSALSIAANRLSYILDLRGPSWAVDTACSSSLVAVHNACQSLRLGECEMAFAGGVNLLVSPDLTAALAEASMLSGDGRCKTFDAAADGYGRGEGCGIVLLKRHSDALRDGDTILALVAGSAVNQDGRSNGLTAPSSEAQQAVIRRALVTAGIRPNAISYVETHGTGTPLGDPIEINALKAVLSEERSTEQRCWFGSVKTNIGHLEAAAGIAGLIKTVLCLRNATLPQNLYLARVNPYIELDGTPFSIPTSQQVWFASQLPRAAGVSSFGFGGTNAHVILHEAEGSVPFHNGAPKEVEKPAWQMLALSAKSPAALRDLANVYVAYLDANPDVSLTEFCFSANTSRMSFQHRCGVVAATRQQLRAQLAAIAAGADAPSAVQAQAPGTSLKITFLFTGQGSHYPGMARELFESEPTFRKALRECDRILAANLETPLLEVLYGAPEHGALLEQTAYAQPALFALEYALATLWRSWGVEPAAVLGHSLGEYVAACVADVITLEDALRLVAERGRLMHAAPGKGEMAAVFADPEQVARIVGSHSADLSIAAFNGPSNTVISGRSDAISAALEKFAVEEIPTQRLRTAHAFHSALMEPAAAAFARVASTVRYHPPRIDLFSNVSGTLAGEDLTSPDYWSRQIRAPVQFAAGVSAAAERGYRTFLEIGPHPILTLQARACVGDDQEFTWQQSLRRGRADRRQMLENLAALYVQGAQVNLCALYEGRTYRRLRLPTYPFQRQRFWIAQSSPATFARDADPAGWLYRLEWRKAPRHVVSAGAPDVRSGYWLILTDRGGLGRGLAVLLEERGERCFLFDRRCEDVPPLDFQNRSKIAEKLLALDAEAALPLRGVIYLWGLDAPADCDGWENYLSAEAANDSAAAVALACTLSARKESNAKLWLVTRAAQAAGDMGQLNCCQSILWGLGKTIALEQPAIWGGLVDLDQESSEEEPARLLAEIEFPDNESSVALREHERYTQRLVRYAPPVLSTLKFRRDASYLITGGLGFLGIQVANWLVQQGAVNLVLAARSAPSAHAALQLAELEKRGARLLVIAADIAESLDVAALLQRIAEEMPPLRGIFHAAGVSGHQPLSEIGASELHATLRPKALGAWHLDRMTDEIDLDVFVCFSSISSLWGSKNFASYAAANHFLDILAHDRRTRGRRSLTINFGPWPNGGMAASHGLSGPLDRLGIHALAPERSLSGLGLVLSSGLPQVAVTDIDWSTFKPLYEQQSRSGLLANIAFHHLSKKSVSDDRDAPLRRALHQASAGERRRLLVDRLQQDVARILGFPESRQFDAREGFFQLGMDSLMAVELRNCLAKAVGADLPVALVFDFPTMQSLSDAILQRLQLDAAPAGMGSKTSKAAPLLAKSCEPIAIIGMACRFPGGADTLDRFWRLMAEGRDTVSRVPEERWDADLHYDPDPEAAGKTYTQYGNFIDNIDLFDAKYFGISPREAAQIDPQHRLLLELSHAALEDTGRPFVTNAGSRTGVFVGLSSNEYARMSLVEGEPERIGNYHVTGNSLNAAAGRVSYALGLNGPSLTVDTACSSSLVAVHLACASLRNGECDEALAAGANLILTPEGMIAASQAKMLSADGRCKTFDASADGYGRGEGGGVVVLARLSDALARGDRVWAVIRGSAMNQDGRGSGFTVPNGIAQQNVIRGALDQAGVSPNEVGYVEAHGTGTPLGDPIEVGALAAVYADQRSRSAPLLVGSVKTNIGHLESAAGIAGLIKTALVLRAGEIPRLANLRVSNPEIAWDQMAVQPVREHISWRKDIRRVAALSSFGVSGTNAHLVLEEAPAVTSGPAVFERPVHLLTLSAKTPEALRQRARDLAKYLDDELDVALADVCFTANARARHHFRVAFVVASRDEAREALLALSMETSRLNDELASSPPKIAFLLNAGAVLDRDEIETGRELYATHPVFRSAIDRLTDTYKDLAGHSLSEMLFGADATWLDDPAKCSPAAFAFNYAVAALWNSWGIFPDVVVGQEAGDLAAAWVRGMLDPEEGLRLSIKRGRDLAGFEYPKGAIAQSSGTADVEHGPGLVECDVLIATSAWPSRMDLHQFPAGGALRLSSVEPGVPVWRTLLDSLAALYVRGADADLQSLDRGYGRRVVSLPTYPFQRRRHWLQDSRPERRASVKKPAPEVPQAIRATELAADKLFYEVQWHETPKRDAILFPGLPRRLTSLDSAARLGGTSLSAGHWLIFADSGGIGADLSRLLRAHGMETTLFAWSVAAPGDQVRISLDQPADYRRAVSEALSTAAPLRGVVHLWSLDAALAAASDNKALHAAVERSSRSALYLAQALADAKLAEPVPLYLVTQGVANVRPAKEAYSAECVAQAPLWGFGKVLASEHSEMRCRLVDLDPAGHHHASELFDELAIEADAQENRVALRGASRYVARLAKSLTEHLKPIRLRADRSYLITGGLGGIGLRVADWLVRQGARHLILLSRESTSAATKDAIVSLERAGASVRVVSADVSQFDQIARVIEPADWPPLAGIVHAAGVVADRLIVDQDWESFEQVFAAKIHGAWNLHRLTENLSLDFFVVFSSASVLFGPAGAASYVAANEFLDALAIYRKGIGLPGLSIAWGPWADVGMASRVGAAQQAEWQSTGMRMLSPADALSAFSDAMNYEASQLAIMAVDWEKFRKHPFRVALRRFVELLEPAQDPIGQDFRVRTSLESAPPSERRNLLREHVRSEVEGVLGWDQMERVNLHHGFFDLGMDSLQANELRNRLQQSLGCALPPTLTFKFPTIAALTAHLAKVIFSEAYEPAPALENLAEIPADAEASGADVQANIGRELAELEKILGVV